MDTTFIAHIGVSRSHQIDKHLAGFNARVSAEAIRVVIAYVGPRPQCRLRHRRPAAPPHQQLCRFTAAACGTGVWARVGSSKFPMQVPSRALLATEAARLMHALICCCQLCFYCSSLWPEHPAACRSCQQDPGRQMEGPRQSSPSMQHSAQLGAHRQWTLRPQVPCQ